MKGIDSSTKTTGQARKILNAGYGAVGVYLRPDRCSLAMINELRQVGLKIWTVYEKGYPTTPGYFSAAKGKTDGQAAAKFASQSIGQPAGTEIYAAVDFDPDHNNTAGPTIMGPIAQYMQAFQIEVRTAGYEASVYGSGRTCRLLIAAGLAKSGWLCQSTSFAEHTAFQPNAAIVQLPRINNSWDGNNILNPAVGGIW